MKPTTDERSSILSFAESAPPLDRASSEDALRLKARAAVRAGKLPNVGPTTIWGGQGSGAPCAVCDSPVSELGYELEFDVPDAPRGGQHVHIRCFAAWRAECRNFETAREGADRPLSKHEVRGTISGRERDTTEQSAE